MMNQIKLRRRKIIRYSLIAITAIWVTAICFRAKRGVYEFNKANNIPVVISQQSSTPTYSAPPTTAFKSTSYHPHDVAPSAIKVPSYTFNSASSYGTGAVRVHTTSSAKMHSVGGGASSAGGGGNYSSSAPSSSVGNTSPVVYSTSSMLLASATRVSSRNLDAATTLAAEKEIIQANGPARQSAHTGFQPDPDIPFPDEEEMPVGDMPWLMMILALASYACVRHRALRVNKEKV